MASRYFGLNRGQRFEDVTDASSSQSKDMELAIDLSKNMTREEIIRNFDYLMATVLKTANLAA